LGWLADEPLGVLGVGGVEDDGAPLADGRGTPVVNVGWRVEPDAGVPVLVVVPTEEPTAEGVGVSKQPNRSGN